MTRHTWQSWRERYKKNSKRLDTKISEIVEQKKPAHGAKGQYGYVRAPEEKLRRIRPKKGSSTNANSSGTNPAAGPSELQELENFPPVPMPVVPGVLAPVGGEPSYMNMGMPGMVYAGPPPQPHAQSNPPITALTAETARQNATEEEMEDDDSQGSLAFFFHEGEDKRGNPSEKVFGVTNNHVARKATNVDYELGRSGAAKAYIRVCGSRRFQAMVNETRALIAKKVSAAKRLAEEIAALEAKPTAEDVDQVEDDASALKRKKRGLEDVNEDNVKLERFLKDLNTNWSDALQRTIGWVDWAPKIRNDVDSRAYTLDISTFELEKSKWKKEFKGNFVYLGAFFWVSLFLFRLTKITFRR